MAKISLNGIGLVTVLAVSGSVVFLVFAKRSIIQKYDQLFKQRPALAAKAKQDIRSMSRVSLAPSCPDQFDNDYVMPGTFLSAKDETKNQITECVSTVLFRLSVEKASTKGINDKHLSIKSLRRTDEYQDLTRVSSHTDEKLDKYAFPNNKRAEDVFEKLTNNKSSVSVPPVSGGVCKASNKVKKVRFAATVTEPKNNNREFRLRPKSSRISRQQDLKRVRLDSCEIRS